MRLEFGIPSHDTLVRVFSRLDSFEFYAALQSWAMEIAGSLHGQTVAFDGKTPGTVPGVFPTALRAVIGSAVHGL